MKTKIACSIALALSLSAGQLHASDGNVSGASTETLGNPQLPSQVNGFIIKYRPGADTNAAMATMRTALARSTSKGSLAAYAVPPGRLLATGHRVVRLSAALDSLEAANVMAQLRADPNVLSVSPDRTFQLADVPIHPAFVPNDPELPRQWHMFAPNGQISAEGHPNQGGVDAPGAWDLADGNGIIVAVIDTGITEHPDIDSGLGNAGFDFITSSFFSGRPRDGREAGGWDTGDWTINYPGSSMCQQRASSWHGTHVAGTVGGQKTHNGLSGTGLAFQAKVLPIRALGHCGGSESDIADAIVWAAGGTVQGVPENRYPAKVINMSLGSEGACSSVEQDAINQATALGAVVVVAAGNAGSDVSNFTPANCQGVIAVASNGITSRRAYYSNFGRGIHISAPGGGVYENDAGSGEQQRDGFIWQALNPGKEGPVPLKEITGAPIAGYVGTSMASPHVAGIVALMQSARLDAKLPLLSPVEVLKILQFTATPFAIPPNVSRQIGPGIVNARAAVLKAITPPCTQDCPPDIAILGNKSPVRGLSDTSASQGKLFSIDVPAKVAGPVVFSTAGGTGDVSMFISRDKYPTASSAELRSARPGNSEIIVVNNPPDGKYYVLLNGNYNGTTLQVRF